MKAPKLVVPKVQRCAVYTRKSTDHNLDLAFNSLDAQREACEAYIKSQAHEGWTLVAERFDDGAFSGASLDRPAVQGLLDRVRAKRIDIVVVYKVDRLTRSLADFAKLVELFDAHEVSFVSVTQSFNTTSSMGRLTLNVLLSFAQFEREVIGERVRDKIAASKRKGIWVGGPVPLGYRSRDKKLDVVPAEAERVRQIFADYLRLGSIRDLAASLNAGDLKPKPRQLRDGRVIAADLFRVGPLAHLLKNRFYLGEVVYRGEVHPGEHPAIVDRDLFEAVQAQMADQAVRRRLKRSHSPALLTGRIFDDRGHAMSPTHANKKGVRYRYYVSQAILQGRKAEAGSVGRVSGPDLEAIVVAAMRREARASHEDYDDATLVQDFLRRITVRHDSVELAIIPPDADADELPNLITLPFRHKHLLRSGIERAPTHSTMDLETRDTLLKAIARAGRWFNALLSGEAASTSAIASAECLAERYVRRLLPLAFLSPRIVEAIDQGTAPGSLTVTELTQSLSHAWRDMERRFLART